jgi:hypothetical protein
MLKPMIYIPHCKAEGGNTACRSLTVIFLTGPRKSVGRPLPLEIPWWFVEEVVFAVELVVTVV